MLLKRQKLITEIEQSLNDKYHSTNRLIADVMRFGHARTSMHISDIPNIEAVLNSITGAEQINLLIHSPGGDGTITEKIVDICRAHLTGANRKLRVIVPNIAKSAATILALGTDEIIMGYTSELGPIDPQVPVNVHDAVGFCVRFCRNCRSDKKGLNIPFTDEMENQIGIPSRRKLPSLFSTNACWLRSTKSRQRARRMPKQSPKNFFPRNCFRFMDTISTDRLQKTWVYRWSCWTKMTRAGLRNAKAKGKSLGRPRVIVDGASIGRLRSQGRTVREIAAELGMSRSLVHKTLANCEPCHLANTAN